MSALAWYDETYGEIGDICAPSSGHYYGCDGHKYSISLQYSNARDSCVDFPVPACVLSIPNDIFSGAPIMSPTNAPIMLPTNAPIMSPTTDPSNNLSASPIIKPEPITLQPTASAPTQTPSNKPITSNPSKNPTSIPITSNPSKNPTSIPITLVPTNTPITLTPTNKPTTVPSTDKPSTSPVTMIPTKIISVTPTIKPSKKAKRTKTPAMTPKLKPNKLK